MPRVYTRVIKVRVCSNLVPRSPSSFLIACSIEAERGRPLGEMWVRPEGKATLVRRAKVVPAQINPPFVMGSGI